VHTYCISRQLHCTLSVVDLRNISPTEETFVARVRMYLLWELDDEAFAAAPDVLQTGAATALTKGNYHTFTASEVSEITEAVEMPSVTFFNASSVEGHDEGGPSLRVYAGVGKVCKHGCW